MPGGPPRRRRSVGRVGGERRASRRVDVGPSQTVKRSPARSARRSRRRSSRSRRPGCAARRTRPDAAAGSVRPCLAPHHLLARRLQHPVEVDRVRRRRLVDTPVPSKTQSVETRITWAPPAASTTLRVAPTYAAQPRALEPAEVVEDRGVDEHVGLERVDAAAHASASVMSTSACEGASTSSERLHQVAPTKPDPPVAALSDPHSRIGRPSRSELPRGHADDERRAGVGAGHRRRRPAVTAPTKASHSRR